LDDVMQNAIQRPFEALTIPLSPDVVGRALPAISTALDGGPAILPLPVGPVTVRDSLLAAMRPELPLETDAALVVPTSGSTGEPKGVLLSATAIRTSAEATHARLGGPGRWLLALPATHVAGVMVLARSIVAGTTPVAVDLTDGFEPEAFAAASVRLLGESRGRRYTSLVPTQLAAILDTGRCALDALRAFDAVLIGGAAASQRLLDRARDADISIVTTYGMTETCGGCVYDGEPLDGVKVEIGEDRTVRIGGTVLGNGYRLDSELTAQSFTDGWFTTTDLGYLDTHGRLTIAGRSDDVAISGGVNVPLTAVDAAVADHPGVREAATIAVDDDYWGHRLVSVVIPSNPGEPPTLESVRAHVARNHPAAFVPKELVLVATLPTLPTGKIDRRAIADAL
jgi:O-succinylbenzoic acid--CoA ligase